MRSKPRELAANLPLSPHKYLSHSPSSAHFYGNFSRASSFAGQRSDTETHLKMKTKACGWAGRRSNKSENMETGLTKARPVVDSKSVTLIGKSSETLDFRGSISEVWNKRVACSYHFDFTGHGRQASKKRISLKRTTLESLCPPREAPECLPATRRYRTHDGTCNNFRRPRWGSAQLPFYRFLAPEYADGLETVRWGVKNIF